jgi:hypothetical protein
MRGESLPALDGLRQEKFKLDLLTDWDFISNRHGEYRSQRHQFGAKWPRCQI